MTERVSLNITEQIKKGVSVLKKGGVIAYPTDTVYGLGAGIGFPEAVGRIYRIKERPLSQPLPLLVSDVSQIEELAAGLTPLARLFIDRFLPGALTLVLPAAASVPGIVTAGGKTVAIRIPNHPVALTLIKGLGMPVVGTSANLSGHPSALTAGDVKSQLGGRVDFVLDGGRCPGGKESTIIDVTGETPVVLREGAISSSDIEIVINK